MTASSGSDTAGIDFNPSEEVRLLRGQLDAFIDREVEPLEREYDHLLGHEGRQRRIDDDGRFTADYREVRDRIAEASVEAGFFAMHLPEAAGGGGVSTLDYHMLLEHLQDRQPDGFHDLVFGPLVAPSAALLPCADDAYQRETFLDPALGAEKRMAFALSEPDHGSDATWMDTTARKEGDEWVIDGTKCFISNAPEADFLVVYARTSGEDGEATGISGFLVEADAPGFGVGRVQRAMTGSVGHAYEAAHPQSFCHFDGCRVPAAHLVGEEGRGFVEAMESIGAFRLHLPAHAVGRSQWLFEQCANYAETRRTFGEPIGSRQHVQDLLVSLRIDIEQVRWLYRHAAWRFDRGETPRWEQSAAKLRGARLWNDAADVAIQVHGGSGLMTSLPFGQEYADARAARVYDGTDEIQKRTIARELLDLPPTNRSG